MSETEHKIKDAAYKLVAHGWRWQHGYESAKLDEDDDLLIERQCGRGGDGSHCVLSVMDLVESGGRHDLVCRACFSHARTCIQHESRWLIVSNKEVGAADMLLFWRPKGAGYTTNLDQAGRFTDEEIARHCGRSARAVRLSDVETRAVRVVPMLASDWSEIVAYRELVRPNSDQFNPPSAGQNP